MADGGPRAHPSSSRDGAPHLAPTVVLLRWSGLGSVKEAEQGPCMEGRWRRGHSPKAPSRSYLESRAGEGNQSCFSLLSKRLAFGSGVNLWRRAILWSSSCMYGWLFGAEQGDGYYKSGVGACSTPEWCLAAEPW